MSLRPALAPALVVCWALSATGIAAAEQKNDGGPPGPARGAAETPKKKDLGAWWHRSSLEGSPTANWLLHIEGTLAYMNASGITSGSTLDTSAMFAARKSRFTNHSFVHLTRKKMVYGIDHSSVDYTERTLREQIDYDITRRLKVVGGMEGYRNTLLFMNHRLSVYGGAGAILFRNEKQQVTFTGGLGYTHFIFDGPGMAMVSPIRTRGLDTEPGSGGALALQTWRWNVSPRFSFSEEASYMDYFRQFLGHRWAINLTGSLPITRVISFTLTYRIKEETNEIVKALMLSPRDRSVLLGIKLSR